MANMESTTIWKQIQQGARDTEQLIGRKEYNLAMVKARQTLEYMVRSIAEKACLVEGDLADTIDQLYEGRWISKGTKDRFHNIRILGNKAVHEGDDTAYDANQAYELLLQEVKVFEDEFITGGRTSPKAAPARKTQRRPASQASGSAQRRRSGSTPQRKKKRRRVTPLEYALRFLVPLLAVILLIVVIRLIFPGHKEAVNPTTTAAVETTEAASVPATTAAPETEPAPEQYTVTGSSVNVRVEPSTGARILVQLSRGDTVEYVKRYNNDWAVINYDGQEAYISSQYIARQESSAEEASSEAN